MHELHATRIARRAEHSVRTDVLGREARGDCQAAVARSTSFAILLFDMRRNLALREYVPSNNGLWVPANRVEGGIIIVYGDSYSVRVQGENVCEVAIPVKHMNLIAKPCTLLAA